MAPSSSTAKKPKRTRASLIPKSVTLTELYAGPIPPGDELIKYEQACPGAADRIITMAEKEADSRHEIELTTLRSNIIGDRIGSFVALILTFSLIGAGIYLTMNGKSVEGITSLLSAPTIQALIIYIVQRNNQAKKVDEKPRT